MSNWGVILVVVALTSGDLNQMIKQGYREQKESYKKIQQLLKTEQTRISDNQVAQQLDELSSSSGSGEEFQVALKPK